MEQDHSLLSFPSPPLPKFITCAQYLRCILLPWHTSLHMLPLLPMIGFLKIANYKRNRLGHLFSRRLYIDASKTSSPASQNF